MVLDEGEVPAGVLGRFDDKSQQSPTTSWEKPFGNPATLKTKMVTRARFERATPSFGGWCSIQLSYRATRADAGSAGERGGTYWIRTSDLCGVNTAL